MQKNRLEAFSDLVFGFSLSLLATRLDIPADSSQIFEATRWSTFIITFTIICVFWLAHYKIFRQHFVPEVPDVAINFVFLLALKATSSLNKLHHYSRSFIDVKRRAQIK